MSKQFIENELDEAYYFFKQGAYQQAVNNLKLIGEIKATSEIAKTKIKQFEKEHDDKLKERFKAYDESGDDELRIDNNKKDQLRIYAKTYLKFYNDVIKQYELY